MEQVCQAGVVNRCQTAASSKNGVIRWHINPAAIGGAIDRRGIMTTTREDSGNVAAGSSKVTVSEDGNMKWKTSPGAERITAVAAEDLASAAAMGNNVAASRAKVDMGMVASKAATDPVRAAGGSNNGAPWAAMIRASLAILAMTRKAGRAVRGAVRKPVAAVIGARVVEALGEVTAAHRSASRGLRARVAANTSRTG